MSLLLVALGGITSAQAQAFDHAALRERARTQFIQPGYVRLQSALEQLQSHTDTLCATPSSTHLQAVRGAFRNTIDAWGRIEFITFGPIAEENRLERIFFWPDRKGIGRRQVERMLASRTAANLDAGILSGRSVAVQGLTALEVLLYGNASSQLEDPTTGARRCAFARAIATNLGTIVGKVIASWADDGAFTKFWLSPSKDNPIYLSGSETTLELVKAYDQVLETVRDRRIVPAIGFGPKRRKRRPILWRSKLGMVLIHGNLAGARALFTRGGLSSTYIASQQGSAEARDAVSDIAGEFEMVLRTTKQLAAMPNPFGQADTRGRLVAIGFPLKNLRAQAVARIKSAAGLSVGFNASDGD